MMLQFVAVHHHHHHHCLQRMRLRGHACGASSLRGCPHMQMQIPWPAATPTPPVALHWGSRDA
jgi:hypothetical protein